MDIKTLLDKQEELLRIEAYHNKNDKLLHAYTVGKIDMIKVLRLKLKEGN